MRGFRFRRKTTKLVLVVFSPLVSSAEQREKNLVPREDCIPLQCRMLATRFLGLFFSGNWAQKRRGKEDPILSREHFY